MGVVKAIIIVIIIKVDGWMSSCSEERAAGAVGTVKGVKGRIFMVFAFLRPAAGTATPRIPHWGIFHPSLALPPLASEHTFVGVDVLPLGVL